jgi:hypothetical protein
MSLLSADGFHADLTEGIWESMSEYYPIGGIEKK